MSTESQETGAVITEAGEQQAAAGTSPNAGNEGATGEQATAGKTATELEAAAAAKPAAEAEVVYEFTAPEGVTLDQAQVEKFTVLAKELKLPADKAQTLVDLVTEVEVQRREQHETLKTKWADEIKADKVLGGDKLDETLATAKKVYSLLPEKEATEFKALMDLSGFGNHPSMVRLLHAVGTALSEDKFVAGGKSPGAIGASGFFDNSNMNP
jgi:hypothetical protein